MRYESLLIDLDDTILDFGAGEAAAYSRALKEHGLTPTQALLDRYRAVNLSWWEKLERGEADRDAILVERHRQMFSELGLDLDPSAFERSYHRFLGLEHDFLPGARELLDYLKGRGYRLFLASNGVAETQYSRLAGAKIGPYFESLFISELAGCHKPDPAYFAWCFARIPGFDRKKTLMIGDSLTSDILGGIRAGIDTLWLNRKGQTPPPELRPTYETASLAQIREIL
ncbi:MAG: YjjG family noncanonical pyrimidine nucleotidase [Oscillospiraceae bacterium]|nr:YjjG family noncanonical pyrimidine nucleotidase [Oscillospiraceae bacterium]